MAERLYLEKKANEEGTKFTQKILNLPQTSVDKYNNLMRKTRVDYRKFDIPRYATVESWSVNLGDGYEADIKVCSSDRNAPLWSEGVLFFHGCECNCTEVSDELLGTYEFEHNGIAFSVLVKAGLDTLTSKGTYSMLEE